MNPVSIKKAGPDYIFEVLTEGDVRSMAPDFASLRRVDMRGVMVTARGADPDTDFVSRFFAPRIGIEEDPS